MVMTLLEENSDIVSFLKEIGFGLIYNNLVIEKKIQNYEIIAKRMMKNMALCDNLENMLNISSMVAYLKKNQK